MDEVFSEHEIELAGLDAFIPAENEPLVKGLKQYFINARAIQQEFAAIDYNWQMTSYSKKYALLEEPKVKLLNSLLAAGFFRALPQAYSSTTTRELCEGGGVACAWKVCNSYIGSSRFVCISTLFE